MVEITEDRRIITGDDGSEIEHDYRQDKVFVNQKWVAVAGREKGAAVAFTRIGVPRAMLGDVARAMDARDGEPCPSRELHVPGGGMVTAKDVVKYGSEQSTV